MLNLKNKALVKAVFLNFSSLWERNPVAAFELVSKCRDSEYKFFGNSRKILQDAALVEADGCVREEIRDIILSTVTGDGVDMKCTIGNFVIYVDQNLLDL